MHTYFHYIQAIWFAIKMFHFSLLQFTNSHIFVCPIRWIRLWISGQRGKTQGEFRAVNILSWAEEQAWLQSAMLWFRPQKLQSLSTKVIPYHFWKGRNIFRTSIYIIMNHINSLYPPSWRAQRVGCHGERLQEMILYMRFVSWITFVSSAENQCPAGFAVARFKTILCLQDLYWHVLVLRCQEIIMLSKSGWI